MTETKAADPLHRQRVSQGGQLVSRPGRAFNEFATRTAKLTGNATTFVLAGLIIAGWAVTGPIFGFSDTWQLVINTSTTIVTFLMVFLIQNTQNRDSAAVQLKLAELIRATAGAHNGMLDLEELADGELETMRTLYRQLATRARARVVAGKHDVGTPDVGTPDVGTRDVGTRDFDRS
jgi:low affinity Fe/Cu permease